MPPIVFYRKCRVSPSTIADLRGLTVLHGAVEWLLTGSVTQLVLAIISKDTRTPLERWVFDIKLVEPPANSTEP